MYSYNVLKKSSRFRQIKRSRRAKLWGILQPGTLIWSRRRTPFVTQSLTLYQYLSLETDEYGLLPYLIVYLEKNNRQYVLVDNIHPLPILTRRNQKQFRNWDSDRIWSEGFRRGLHSESPTIRTTRTASNSALAVSPVYRWNTIFVYSWYRGASLRCSSIEALDAAIKPQAVHWKYTSQNDRGHIWATRSLYPIILKKVWYAKDDVE